MKVTPARTLRRCLLLGCMILGLAPVTPVSAQSSGFVFRGSGWGHGLGMSQYGAKGGAEAGRTYGQILTHYYQGTQVAVRTMPSEIRIGLIQSQTRITVRGTGRFDFVMDGQVVASGAANQEWAVVPGAGGTYLIEAPDGRRWTTGDPSRPLILQYANFGTLVATTGHQYRYGFIEFNTHDSAGWKLRALIHLPMQEYLYGLGEMPSSWPAEALKAQATAARTYAFEKMSRLGNRSICNCHLFDDTRDQAYVGTASERAAWKAAVDATADRVVTYNNQPIQAYYSSSSGGHTENNEYVWGGSAIPYLRGVNDPWDRATSPYIDWTVTFTRVDLQNRLNSDSRTSVGTLQSIETLDPYGVSGRVRPVIDANRGGVRITGSSSVKRVSGDVVRSVLGLRSTLFRIESDQLGPPHPDGTVLKGPGPTHWLLVGGTRVPVPTEAVFNSHYRTWQAANVSDATINRYPTARQPFREGTLLHTPDGWVWAISNGLRRHVSSESVFNGLGYSWSNVRWVSAEEAAIHQVGAPLTSTAKHPDGTLIKGSTPTIYVLENGHKRPIISKAILDSQYRSEEVVTVSDSAISGYPTGTNKGFRDGTLIHTPDGKVWAISRGVRRHVISEAIFNGLRYSWEDVRWVSEAEAATHPVGAPLDVAVHPDGALLKASGPAVYVLVGRVLIHIPTEAVLESGFRWGEIITLPGTELSRYPAAQVVFRDGSLIHTPDGKVWAISNGLRRHVSSEAAFNALGFSWSNVRWVSFQEGALHVPGLALNATDAHPDGSLLKAGGPAVYYIENGRRRWVPYERVLESRFRWEEIITVSESRLTRFAEGDQLGFREGTLIGTPDGKVWAISKGLRRHITSEGALRALGFDFGQVVQVSDAEAALHPIGPPIP